MTTSLRDAAETTAHTIAETLTETIPGFAADARDKLESIAPHRSARRRSPRAAFAAGALLIVAIGLVLARLVRGRQGHGSDATDDADASSDDGSANVSSLADRGTGSVNDNGFTKPDTKGAAMSGSADKAKGRIKQAAGDLTDNDEMRREGKVDETAGKVKDAATDAVDSVKDKLHR
jgi:uncharacterized protein YjbJ (UPF0337 family)